MLLKGSWAVIGPKHRQQAFQKIILFIGLGPSSREGLDILVMYLRMVAYQSDASYTNTGRHLNMELLFSLSRYHASVAYSAFKI